MPLKDNEFMQQFSEFFFKIFFPAFSGISIKLATMMTKEKITPLRAILSYVIGILSSYLTYPMILEYSSQNMQPMFIAIIAMSGEKIGEFIIYKWNIDLFLTSILEAFRLALLKIIGK